MVVTRVDKPSASAASTTSLFVACVACPTRSDELKPQFELLIGRPDFAQEFMRVLHPAPPITVHRRGFSVCAMAARPLVTDHSLSIRLSRRHRLLGWVGLCRSHGIPPSSANVCALWTLTREAARLRRQVRELTRRHMHEKNSIKSAPIIELTRIDAPRRSHVTWTGWSTGPQYPQDQLDHAGWWHAAAGPARSRCPSHQHESGVPAPCGERRMTTFLLPVGIAEIRHRLAGDSGNRCAVPVAAGSSQPAVSGPLSLHCR